MLHIAVDCIRYFRNMALSLLMFWMVFQLFSQAESQFTNVAFGKAANQSTRDHNAHLAVDGNTSPFYGDRKSSCAYS